MELSQLTDALQNRTAIGITGHRDLMPHMQAAIKSKLYDKLVELSNDHKDAVLLTSLAAGADQLAAHAALEADIPFIALLPMSKAFYERDFTGEQEVLAFNDLLKKSEAVFIVNETEQLKLDDERNIQYLDAGQMILAVSKHMLALWDGVYNGKCGGTSEIVRFAISGIQSDNSKKNTEQQLFTPPAFLHHLLTTRISNPFPVNDPNISSEIRRELEWTMVNVPRLLHIHRKTSKIYGRHSEFIRKFAIPFLLILATLIFGWFGFNIVKGQNTDAYNGWDAFFDAANLITLNSSVLHLQSQLVPWQLHLARILGLITAIYTIAGAFIWAASDLYKRAVIFYWCILRKKEVNLVIGLNEKSFNLVKDLSLQKKNTVILNSDAGSRFITSSQHLGAIVYAGNPGELSDLDYVYFKHATNIFIFSESDTENVRIMQGIDEHVSTATGKLKRSFYVHINDLKQKEFLAHSTRADISIFNIYENAVRRLLIRHPLDRFQYSFYHSGENKHVQVMIIGFNAIAWELALAVLRLGHYTTNISMKLTVFTEGEDQQAKAQMFKQRYGRIFLNNEAVDKDTGFLSEVLPEVEFLQLPGSDAVFTDPDSPVFQRINLGGETSMNIFTCMEDSLKSAACLSLLLPRLDYLKHNHLLNMQVFCYYNSPDETEEDYIEYKINKIGAHIPVYCFGNFVKACMAEAIKNNHTDLLAKQIAFWYYLIYKFKDDTGKLNTDISNTFTPHLSKTREEGFRKWMTKQTAELASDETTIEDRIKPARELLDAFWDMKLYSTLREWWNMCWLTLPENQKESNRQAADHIYVKLRCIDKMPGDVKSIEDLGIGHIELLSSIEHRRWCTEKFIDGWHRTDNKTAWSLNEKAFKSQKLHYDLRPFESLTKFEKQKDHNQILGIPYFLKGLNLNPSTS